MSDERPVSPEEWASYVSKLSGEQLRSKAIAANSIRFVQALQADRLDPETINYVFRLFARQFVATGQEPPSDGYVDLKQIAETDPEISNQYQAFVEDEMANRERLTNTFESKWGATLGKTASTSKEADYSDSYKKQYETMKSHPPKVQKSGGLWCVSIWSVTINKYMEVAEWKDQAKAKSDLKMWKDAHKDTLKRLQAAMKEHGEDSNPTAKKAEEGSEEVEKVAEVEKEAEVSKEADTEKEADIQMPARRTPGGLYEYPKAIQRTVEATNRKFKKAAIASIRRAYEKDRRVLAFLNTHVKRAKSNPARVLLAAMKEAYPVLASMGVKGGKTVEAGKQRYGLYGYPSKVASLGLQACSEIREQAGQITADLHRRKAKEAVRILGFLDKHAKKARCQYSKMLRMAYPDPQMKLASSKPPAPNSVTGWLEWED